MFVLGSAMAALSPGTGALIAARVVQGAGAACLVPLTLTLISDAFPAEQRGAAIGMYVASGPQRKETAPATSAASPTRRSGLIRPSASASRSATNGSLSGVSTQPGATALTRMPSGASSTAIDLVSEMSAALDAL